MNSRHELICSNRHLFFDIRHLIVTINKLPRPQGGIYTVEGLAATLEAAGSFQGLSFETQQRIVRRVLELSVPIAEGKKVKTKMFMEVCPVSGQVIGPSRPRGVTPVKEQVMFLAETQTTDEHEGG